MSYALTPTGATMRALQFAVSVAGLVALANALAAQQPDTLSPAQQAGLALARLGAGQRVLIVTKENELVEGSVLSTSPHLISLRTNGSVVEVPARSVDSLWVRRGTHAGEGGLIGLVVGGLGLGVWAASSVSSCSSTAVNCFGKGDAFGADFLLGSIGGAVVGALIGAGLPKWQQRVP